ncbi:MAG TPA: PEP/pyruvate-binding domain-containing protein [Gemmataceae bacterium]|jgi:pyruvate,water dikinase|nr:PEP/pyruvate-binding domain-containing protein [Gemmataceae bacterium]
MTTSERRHVYFFGQGQADAGSELRHLVGGKGASLGDMTRANLNVPPGFTISAECCDFAAKNGRWPDGLADEVRTSFQRLETLAGRPFGRGSQPLLVAVRSGAAHSMPGMMDTILNVGLNPDCVRAMGQRLGNLHGSWQAYLHFQIMFARTVTDLPEAKLDAIVHDGLKRAGKTREEDLSPPQLEATCGQIAMTYQRHSGKPFPVDPWDTLTAAIDAVFGSWMNDRAVSYRAHHKIEGLLGTAVNVQMMCPSEVSGVMFTADPVDASKDEMIVEASFGLGEAIVLGKVTPDRFILSKPDVRVLEKHIAKKDKIVATLTESTAAANSDGASLTDEQVIELGRLGLRVEEYFKHPCDLEWAVSQEAFFLLQARAIKHKGAARIDPKKREAYRQAEIARLKKMAAPGGTVWSRFNLSEILPDATPMTWSIVRRFMSSHGGFGLMYRDLGYSPDPAMVDECAFDLVAGRVYCNLTRDPRMQFGSMPYEHDFAKLKKEPAKAIYPTPDFKPRKAGLGFWMKLPLLSIQQGWGESKRSGLLLRFSKGFVEQTVPEFVKATEAAWKEDWASRSPLELLKTLDDWRKRTLDDFARESLKPTALAAIQMAKLEGAFARRYQPPGQKLKPGEVSGDERAKAAVRDLTMGARPPADADLAGGIEKLAAKKMPKDAFVAVFGHRGSHEMELAQPRWAEEPEQLDSMMQNGTATSHEADAFGLTLYRVGKELKLTPFQVPFVERELRSLHELLGLREAGKHYMLRGYALIRRALVLLDERYDLSGGIFFLTLDELPELVKLPPADPGLESFRKRIEERRAERDIAMSLMLPQVLFSDDLEAIGRKIEVDGAGSFQGTALSAGHAEAVAWVLEDVAGATPPPEPYILVCPTTDPAWVPLFGQAKGLVMETGGVLSHGAIVAREFGLPAVAGIPDVHRRLRTGQRLFVDGGTGIVKVMG